jgi:HEAT repeat protein
MANHFFLPFIGISASLLILLAVLLIFQKLSRSRRERVSALRRDRYRALLRSACASDLQGIAREARRRRAAEEDLTAVLGAELERLGHDRLERLREAGRLAGLEGLARRRLHSRSAVRRGRAALLLARLGSPGVEAELEPLLLDRDPDVRHVALCGLALQRSEEAAWALVRALPAVAVQPERIVERLGAPWAAAPLLDGLKRAELAAARAWIVEALGLAGERAAAPSLAELLTSGSAEERVRACRALGRLGGRDLAPMFIAALADSFGPVRAQAARGLGDCGNPTAVGPLARCLGDRDWWVRANAAEALRKLGAPGIAALQLALDHEDPFARERAAEALALARRAVVGGKAA